MEKIYEVGQVVKFRHWITGELITGNINDVYVDCDSDTFIRVCCKPHHTYSVNTDKHPELEVVDES